MNKKWFLLPIPFLLVGAAIATPILISSSTHTHTHTF